MEWNPHKHGPLSPFAPKSCSQPDKELLQRNTRITNPPTATRKLTLDFEVSLKGKLTFSFPNSVVAQISMEDKH